MAGKRKNPADNWMPPRVFRGRSAYEFKHPDGRTIRLCALSVDKSVVWNHYEQLVNEEKNTFTYGSLVDDFLRSADFIDLAKDTQSDYRKYSKKVVPVFGKMNPNNIRPDHIRKYMDKRGLQSRTQANREKTFMSRVFRWGYERGLVKRNPCQGVKQYRENSRERYITDAEYQALYEVSPTVIQVAMEIAYLCCARQKDILTLSKSQLMEAGIYIKQHKTGKSQIKGWSERLRKAIKLASSLPLKDGLHSLYIIHQANGKIYSRDGFNSRWLKAKEIAAQKYPELNFNFTFHDLKAKGISDLEGTLQEKQAISGHKDIGQTARYDRKTEIVPVVGNQKK
ncbi:tyrosine-type recombinase/integrase [Xenorhabdus hominickii]|uniref:Integrase n=1 Tax=Xenorhabdus hominickii TaxID=351679 RepID=A0A2G0Q606_XENHO|nr:tyrosine-type recombinase/integrase [Xenorhabdus hominickii]AOM39593.1 integrase [Xenorhabdus hominickii]PHM54633.1 integrase [Xenorhabdus hominickii]